MYAKFQRPTKTFLLQFPHTNRQKSIYQLPDQRPSQIAGRIVSTAHQRGVSARSELATLRFNDAVVDFIERSGRRTRNDAAANPRSAWEFHEKILAWHRLDKSFFFPENLNVPKRKSSNMGLLYIADLSGIGWLRVLAILPSAQSDKCPSPS